MNLSNFKIKIQMLDENFLKSILDGSALVMIQDKELGLGSSNGAFVIFWIEDEKFSSTDDLRAYLDIEAEDLFSNYYAHSPLSKEYFETKLSDLMNNNGEASFTSQPGDMPEKSLIVSDGELSVLTEADYIFKYGLYLQLEEKLNSKISAVKARNWLQSGAAYNDYIAVNVFRFSAIE
jgi:hypothetical protein